MARRYEVLRPHLSEFQRRLWLGAEAAELGPGGVGIVAAATGVAADTVRRGRKEADDGTAPGSGRSRRSGGGRKRAEAHDGELVAAFELLIDPVTRGDPMSALRWTSKSIRTLTAAMREKGHQVSDFVIRRLLRGAGLQHAGQREDRRGRAARRPGRPVRLPQHPGRRVHRGRGPGDQRGHQEEGTHRGLQERRPGMAPRRATRTREGPRLHRPSTGQGQPLRGVRRRQQHRLGQRGHRPRHRRVRREHHRHLVGAGRTDRYTRTLPGC